MPVIETPTDEQIAILDFVRAGKGNLLIDALAGSGKSSILKASLEVIPQRSVLMCAFNKRIADGLKTTLPPIPNTHAVHVKTFHAQGLAMLSAHHPRLAISADATEELINRTAGQSIGFQMRRSAVRLLRTLKETTCTPRAPSAAVVLALGHEYDLFGKLTDQAIDLTVEVVRDAYLVSLDFTNRESIDFCDMVWAPLALNLPPKTRYHAIFVDETQDVSELQFEMLRRLMTPPGRMIAVGDRNQSIYQFRGANASKMFSIIQGEMKAKTLPLTITWRCARSVVEQARAIVPQLRARPDAPAGLIRECTWTGLPAEIDDLQDRNARASSSGIHTFVLSRNNAHILDCALYLWRERVQFQLNAGSELLEPLNALIDRLDTSGTAAFKTSLAAWRAAELAKAEKLNATAWADRVEEQTAMLMVALTYAAPNQLKGLLHSIIQPNRSGVLLSTVHKVKGLEAERVFLLKQTFARHDDRACFACGGDGRFQSRGLTAMFDQCPSCGGTGKFVGDIDPAEFNIEYVAITRAKSRLIWVDIRHRSDADRRRSIPRDSLGIVSERDQLINAATKFENGGMSRAMAEGLANPPQGEHARDTMTNVEPHEDPTDAQLGDYGDPPPEPYEQGEDR